VPGGWTIWQSFSSAEPFVEIASTNTLIIPRSRPARSTRKAAAPEGLTGEAAVRQLVEWQRQTGLDIINEAEYTKGGDWLSFTDDRFGGFTAGERRGPPIVRLGKDREEFAHFYKWASERGTLFFEPGDQIKNLPAVQ
jgi:hypothetical protein